MGTVLFVSLYSNSTPSLLPYGLMEGGLPFVDGGFFHAAELDFRSHPPPDIQKKNKPARRKPPSVPKFDKNTLPEYSKTPLLST